MATKDQAYPYDVKFVIEGTPDTEIGFMLVSPPGETKQLAIAEAGQPDAQRIQSEAQATNQDFDPSKDTPFAQNNFSGGMGQLFFDFRDDSRYLWGSGLVTHVDGKVYLAPSTNTETVASETGSITGFLSHIISGTQYDFIWTDDTVYRRTATNDTNDWTLCYTAAGNFPITSIVIYDGLAVVATPSSTNSSIDFHTCTNLTGSWTATSRNHTVFSNGNKPKFFGKSRGTIFALVDNNKVYYNVDPTANSWLGPIDTTLENNISGPPGDESYPFVGWTAVSDFIMVAKQDAVYSIDSAQDVTEIIWQWKEKPSAYNFKYSATDGNHYIFTVGPEVYMYDPSTGTTPTLNLSKQDGFSVKEIHGVGADNQYIYVLAKVRANVRSADSEALIRCSKLYGNTYGFECLWEDTSIGSKTYHNLFVAPNGYGSRVYIGVIDTNTKTIIMDIPASWDESTTADYQTSGSLYTSISYSGFFDLTKRHLYLRLTGEADADNTIAVYYSTDNGANFSLLDTLESNADSFEYTNTYSKNIMLRFDFTSDDGSETPVLNTFAHHQRVRFIHLESGQAGVRIGENIELRNRKRDTRSVATQIANLRSCRREDAPDIMYYDYLGNAFKVSIDNIVIRPTRHSEPVDELELEGAIAFTRADKGN